MFYTVVGRVAWSPHTIHDDFPVATFMFCLGVEDVMVHLMHSVRVWADWLDPEGPSKALQAALNLPFCSEPFSSFAVLLVNRLTCLEGDFKDPTVSERITCALMKQWRCTLSILGLYREDSI